MAHSHVDKTNNNKELSLAFWLNLGFSIIELIGGVFTNSTAIIADAFHDFMDAIAIGVAVILEKISGKKRTPQFTYGYRRFSLLSALGISLILLLGAAFMVAAAIRSFIYPEAVNSTGMLWLAFLGIFVNGFAFLRIKNANGHTGHSHSHSHHGHVHSHLEEGENFNSKAIMLHLLEDLLGWVAVLIGAITIALTGWVWIDGLLALGIACFIGYNASRNLFSTMKIMLQSAPSNVDTNALYQELTALPEINNIHDFHVWSIDGRYHIGSLHAIINLDNQSHSEMMATIIAVMEKYKINHPTVQIETQATNCKLINC